MGNTLGEIDFEKRARKIDGLRMRLIGKRNSLGRAFKTLVDAGCDREWLESVVLRDWYQFPWKRAKNLLGAQELNKIMATASALEREAEKLSPYFVRLVPRALLEDGLAAEHIMLGCGRLKDLAGALRLACRISKQQQRTVVELTASRRIPHVLSEIRRMTGRPHFEEMATLYQASYERKTTSHEMKSLEVRERARLRRKRNESAKDKR